MKQAVRVRTKIKIHQGPEEVLPVPAVNRKGSHKNEKSEESKF